MKQIIHFKSSAERLAYLKHGFEEILPKEVELPKAEEKPSVDVHTPSDASSEPKPKAKRKVKKKEKKDGTVQA